MTKYVMGVDLGTSSLKVILVNPKGDIVAQASENYEVEYGLHGEAQQDPLDWLDAFDVCMMKLINKVPTLIEHLEGISFSGQMHTLVLLDENHEVIRPAILWNDVRTAQEVKEIQDLMGETIESITKNVILEGFTLPKILWIQKHEPQNWKRVKKILLPKDYLRYALTHQFHMDYSDAAGTLLFDVEAKHWSTSILDKFEIKASQLPKVCESNAYVGDLISSIKDKYGLTSNVKVFAGGADNAISSLSTGILEDDMGLASIGTSGVFLTLLDVPFEKASSLHCFNHALENRYYTMGVSLSAGNSLSWFRDTFYPNERFEDLLKDVSQSKPGANGLIFTPYLTGERTPHQDALIRGSFIGIRAHHQKHDFVRAVLEGIVFSLNDAKSLIEKTRQDKIKRIVSVGGGAKDKTWLQIQANVFDAQIYTLKTDMGPSLGAAMLAAVGCGWFESMSACASYFVKYEDEIIYPNVEDVKKYEKIYPIYQSVYHATKDVSHALSELT